MEREANRLTGLPDVGDLLVVSAHRRYRVLAVRPVLEKTTPPVWWIITCRELQDGRRIGDNQVMRYVEGASRLEWDAPAQGMQRKPGTRIQLSLWATARIRFTGAGEPWVLLETHPGVPRQWLNSAETQRLYAHLHAVYAERTGKLSAASNPPQNCPHLPK